MPRVAPEYRLEYKEEVKRKIIEAGLRAFVEKGYHNTTMGDVAEKLHVSKGTLYLYFTSKEELLRAIGEKFQDRLKEILKNMFNEGGSLDFDNIFEDPSFSREDFTHFWADMLSECARDETLRKMISENVEMRIHVVQQFLVEQRKNGVIHAKGDLRPQSIAALTMLMGATFLRILKFDDSELRRVTKKSLDTILETE